jgi:ribosomal protein L13E
MADVRAKIIREQGRQRNGRGFSRMELKKSGLNLQEAARMKLSLDQRRKTIHEHNVETIKTFVATVKVEAKPKPEPEQELKKKAKS